MKSLRDELESIGHSISKEEKLKYVLRGLDEQFDGVFVNEKILSEMVTIDDVKELLLSHKS